MLKSIVFVRHVIFGRLQIISQIHDICNVISESADVVMAGQLFHDLNVPTTRNKLLDGFKNDESLPRLYFYYARKMWMKNLIPYKIKSLIKDAIYKIKG